MSRICRPLTRPHVPADGSRNASKATSASVSCLGFTDRGSLHTRTAPDKEPSPCKISPGTMMLTVLLLSAAGACYWQLGGNTETAAGILSTLGSLLYASLFLGVLNSIFVQPLIASERQVFYREKAAGMYSVHAWYLGMVRALWVCANACSTRVQFLVHLAACGLSHSAYAAGRPVPACCQPYLIRCGFESQIDLDSEHVCTSPSHGCKASSMLKVTACGRL